MACYLPVKGLASWGFRFDGQKHHAVYHAVPMDTNRRTVPTPTLTPKLDNYLGTLKDERDSIFVPW